MKKFKKRIIALMAAFQLFMNVPVIGLFNVSAAEAFAYQDALIPIEAFATAIAIGSGIVASQSQAAVDGASEMLRKAVASVKAKACEDSETEFRVIDGGRPRKPKKGDDKNNRKWFTIAAGSVATGSLIAGLKASREMMQEIYVQNGYKEVSDITGLLSKEDLIKEAGVNAITEKISSGSYKGFLKSWDNYLDWLNRTVPKSQIENMIFYVCAIDANVYMNYTPRIRVTAFVIDDNFSYFKYNIGYDRRRINIYYDNNNYHSYITYSGTGTFYDKYDVACPLKYYQWTYADTPQSSYSVYTTRTDDAIYAYWGVDFVDYNLYQLTNNIYNPSQNQQENFPNWLHQSIETLNGNLAGLNLAINNLQLPQTWNDTQTNIQTGTAPANVINQYINNWSNPEQAPDPGPNPDPDPEPEPGPGEQPAAEAAVEESGKDLFDWAIKKVTLPDGFFDKLPFSIPYDIYLLLKSLFPSGKSSARRVYSVRSAANVGDTDPNGLTISSRYEALGISTKTHSNKWVKTAPVINLDIHWKYHGVDGTEKTIDIVKKVDLSSISYFAMIVYISIYVFWFFELLSWIMSSFKG